MEKIIHYCWFRPRGLGKLEKKCLKSWKKHFPDYKIMRWSEENINLDECEFIRDAYTNKKWAYVADYIRIKALYEYGGIYFDTDMEVIKNMDDFTDKELVLGLEDSTRPNAAFVLAKEKHNKYLKELLDAYKKMKFNETGNLFDICIPKLLEQLLLPYGLICGSSEIQILNNEVYIYPREYFYPLSYDYQDNIFTSNTYMIHYFNASWIPFKNRISTFLIRHRLKFIVNIIQYLKKQKNNEKEPNLPQEQEQIPKDADLTNLKNRNKLNLLNQYYQLREFILSLKNDKRSESLEKDKVNIKK